MIGGWPQEGPPSESEGSSGAGRVARRQPSGADFQRLADAITALSGARDGDEIIEIVRRSARGLSGAQGIAVILNDEGHCHYLVEDSESPLWAGQKFPIDACISGWAMTHNETVAIPDIFADSRIPHASYHPTFVRSLIMVPVGEVAPFAAIGAYWDRVREPEAEEIAVLQALARSAATAFKNVQLYESLRREAARTEELYRRAEEQLALKEQALAQIRFQAGLLDAVEQAVIATDLQGRVTYWSRHAERLYGWSVEEAVGAKIIDLIMQESEPSVAEILRMLSRGESWSGEMTLSRKDGSLFAAQITDSPIHDAEGRLAGIVGVSADITQRKKSEQHLKLMVNELNHRVKNSLATVQSIAAQTFRATDSAAEAKTAFAMRLHALSLIHEMLTESNWDSADLGEIAQRTLNAHLGPECHRARIDGPQIRLSPKAASSLAIALNELATNAVRHGALSNASGVVEIAWRPLESAAGPQLKLDWREIGGPVVEEPMHSGFGERLLRRSLPSDLECRVDLAYAASGVTCTICAPLSALKPKPSDPALAV
jgi:PAS domain S-box-containing protein